MTGAVEIPPLEELIKLPVKEIADLSNSLSFPEILIVASRPLNALGRQDSEVALFNEIARRRLKKLEKERDGIGSSIAKELNLTESSRKVEVSDYFQKYEFLTDRRLVTSTLEREIQPDILRDLRQLRESIDVYLNRSNGRKIPNLKLLKKFEETSVNLRYMQYRGGPVYIICSKTKADDRMASKIPYKTIEGYREREGTPIKGHKSFKQVTLSDGITKDNVGLQVITWDTKYLGDVKRTILKSTNIEVLKEEIHGMDGPYQAIHLSAARGYHGTGEGDPLFNPHRDEVEIILMDVPSFVGGNFGDNSYWNRMMAQEKGIVQKRFRHGRRVINHFTPFELQWKERTQERILRILNYHLNGNPYK